MGAGASHAALPTEEQLRHALLAKLGSEQPAEHRLQDAFSRFDTLGSGFVTREHFQHAVATLGFGEIEQEQLDLLVEMFDVNKDGWVSHADFTSFICKGTAGACIPPPRSFETAVQQCKATGDVFSDESFPADEVSLWGPSRIPPPDQRLFPEWRRPKDFGTAAKPFDEPLTLFRGDPTPGDVLEGALGDCFFISAVSVLCRRPQLIRQLFISDGLSSEGVYAIRLFLDGRWRVVVIDDMLPCNSQTGLPAFGHTHHPGELWLTLLEKAYAKLYGSFAAISGGNVSEALRDLTGCAVQDFNLANGETRRLVRNGELWEELSSRLLQTYVLTGLKQPKWRGEVVVGCAWVVSAVEEQRARQRGQSSGLLPNHAYSITGMVTVMDSSSSEQQEVQLVRVRNPWGAFEWKGDWSSNSRKWSPELREQLGYGAKGSAAARAALVARYGNSEAAQRQAAQDESVDESGEFWMAWEDFSTRFNRVYVCLLGTSLEPPGNVGGVGGVTIKQQPRGAFSAQDSPREANSRETGIELAVVGEGGATSVTKLNSTPSIQSLSAGDGVASGHGGSSVVEARWLKRSAGGCDQYCSWRNNPVFELKLPLGVGQEGDCSSVVINLSQPDTRKQLRSAGRSVGYNQVGITVIRPYPGDAGAVGGQLVPGRYARVARTSFWNKRDVACEVSVRDLVDSAKARRADPGKKGKGKGKKSKAEKKMRRQERALRAEMFGGASDSDDEDEQQETAGPLIIVPSTFFPGQEGRYWLSATIMGGANREQPQARPTLTAMDISQTFPYSVESGGEWRQGDYTAAGGLNFGGKNGINSKYWQNPLYSLRLLANNNGRAKNGDERAPRSVRVVVFLSQESVHVKQGQPQLQPFKYIAVHCFDGWAPLQTNKANQSAISPDNLVGGSDTDGYANLCEVSKVLHVQAGGGTDGEPYVLVPSLSERGLEGKFRLHVLSEVPMKLQREKGISRTPTKAKQARQQQQQQQVNGRFASPATGPVRRI
jgi:hypothetical protein